MHSSPGGKATNLLRLQSLGFPVPPFRVVLPGEPIAPALDALRADFPHIARWAVRSSATAEDGAQFSFAGQFLSLLNVAPDGLEAAVEARPGLGAQRSREGILCPPRTGTPARNGGGGTTTW